MFRAIMTLCSLDVRTMRACAQGVWAACPPGGGLGGPRPPNDGTDSDLLSESGVLQLNLRTDLLLGNLLSVESTFGDGVVLGFETESTLAAFEVFFVATSWSNLGR